jgi:hypothetical protein
MVFENHDTKAQEDGSAYATYIKFYNIPHLQRSKWAEEVTEALEPETWWHAVHAYYTTQEHAMSLRGDSVLLGNGRAFSSAGPPVV